MYWVRKIFIRPSNHPKKRKSRFWFLKFHVRFWSQIPIKDNLAQGLNRRHARCSGCNDSCTSMPNYLGSRNNSCWTLLDIFVWGFGKTPKLNAVVINTLWQEPVPKLLSPNFGRTGAKYFFNSVRRPLNLLLCLQVVLGSFLQTVDPLAISGALAQQDSRGLSPAAGGIESLFSTLPLYWRIGMNQIWNFLSTRRHLGRFGGRTGVAKFNISWIESREPCILNLAPNCP